MPEELEAFDETTPADLPALALRLTGSAQEQHGNYRRQQQRGIGEIGSLDAEKVDQKAGDDRRGQLRALHHERRQGHGV